MTQALFAPRKIVAFRSAKGPPIPATNAKGERIAKYESFRGAKGDDRSRSERKDSEWAFGFQGAVP